MQAATATQLASLRFKRLLHYNITNDTLATDLVNEYYVRLNGDSDESIQKQIERRNEGRKSKNLLAYRYMQPKELTNSIAI